MQFLQQLKSERGGRARSETLDQRRCAPEHPFMKALAAQPEPKDEDEVDQPEDTSKPAMFRFVGSILLLLLLSF